MKTIAKKITAVFLALQVLLVTTSFTVDYHYCSKDLIDFSIIGSADICQKTQSSTSEDCSMEMNLCESKDCCRDETFIKEGSKEIKLVLNELDVESNIFLAAFYYSYINLFEGLEKNIVPFKSYRPPLIKRDISVLYETFLI